VKRVEYRELLARIALRHKGKSNADETTRKEVAAAFGTPVEDLDIACARIVARGKEGGR